MDQHNQCVFSSMDALAIPMGALVQLVEKIGLADIGCNFSLGLQYQLNFWPLNNYVLISSPSRIQDDPHGEERVTLVLVQSFSFPKIHSHPEWSVLASLSGMGGVQVSLSWSTMLDKSLHHRQDRIMSFDFFALTGETSKLSRSSTNSSSIGNSAGWTGRGRKFVIFSNKLAVSRDAFQIRLWFLSE